MNDLFVFEYENQSVRSILIDGEPWFCLSDCLKAIGTRSRTNDAKALIEEELDKGYVTNIPLETAGGKQDLLFIAEPALTFLLGRSRTEAGKRFNRWVHGEVLLSIRKTGKFELQKEALERQFQPEVPLKSRQNCMTANPSIPILAPKKTNCCGARKF